MSALRTSVSAFIYDDKDINLNAYVNDNDYLVVNIGYVAGITAFMTPEQGVALASRILAVVTEHKEQEIEKARLVLAQHSEA
jgi:hypothetical protein